VIDPLHKGTRITGTRTKHREIGKKVQGNRIQEPSSRLLTFTNDSTDNALRSDLSYNKSLSQLQKRTDLLEREDNHRRRLRLKWSEGKLNNGKSNTKSKALEFLPELHRYSTQKRLEQYHSVYKKISSKLRKDLDKINLDLKTFGYSLEKGKENYYIFE
jgi:hypothetical protein